MAAAGAGHGFYKDDLTWLEAAAHSGNSVLAALGPWKPGEFRPLATLLFWLEVKSFGLRPLLFNAVSLALHAFACWQALRLARRLLGSEVGAALAAGLFALGLGHYQKPISWASSQSILLGACFALSAARLAHATADLAPDRTRGKHLAAIGLLLLALLSHEIFMLAPLACGWIWWRQARGTRPWAVLAAVLSIAYVLLTAAQHRQHPLQSSLGHSLARNVLAFAAAFVLPAQSLSVLERWSLPNLAGPATLMNLVQILVGVGFSFGVLAAAARQRAKGFDLLVWSGALLAPAFVVPMPSSWVETRYLYPAAPFVAMLLAMPIVDLWNRPRALVARIGLVSWFALILLGAVTIQLRAYQQAAPYRDSERWRRVRGLFENKAGEGTGEVPIPIPSARES